MGVLATVRVLPAVAAAVLVLMSLIAFFLYRAICTDKAAAIQGTWRTPESTLQVVSVLGGWPGALIAQRIYRHKTRKQPFQTVFWIAVVANCAVLAWVAIRSRISQPFPL